MTKEIRKEPDFWGNFREVIYVDGKKVGEIREEKTPILGEPIKVEYDNENKKVSETRTDYTWRGEEVERTYIGGRRVTETRHEKTAILGEPVDRTYARDGSLISEMRYELTPLGVPIKRISMVKRSAAGAKRDSAESEPDGSSAGSPVRESSSSAPTPSFRQKAPKEGQWPILLIVYGGICTTLFIGYLAISGLKALGYVSPEMTASLWRWLQSTSKTPVGVLVLLLLSPGLLLVGLVALMSIVRLLLPVALAVALAVGFIKSELPWPLTVAAVAAVVTALVLYFVWLGKD